VIEGRAGPGGGVVAVQARGREELRLRRVAWIGGVVVVGLMTTDTRSGQRRVVVIYMAVCAHARRHQVRTGQRESGVVVIKRRIHPVCRVVAEFARSRESGGSVRGIIRAGVVLLVARIAQRAVQRIVIVDMAVRALPRRHGVISRQRETRTVVIESGIGPRSRVVALLACLGKTRRHVIGIGRCLIVL